jgi:hypothetical protein
MRTLTIPGSALAAFFLLAGEAGANDASFNISRTQGRAPPPPWADERPVRPPAPFERRGRARDERTACCFHEHQQPVLVSYDECRRGGGVPLASEYCSTEPVCCFKNRRYSWSTLYSCHYGGGPQGTVTDSNFCSALPQRPERQQR